MQRSTTDKIEELREKASEYDAETDALESLQEELKEVDQIGETQLSKLFHEARTSSPRSWKSATAFCNIEDGEVVVDHVSKIREGRWSPETRDPYDVIIFCGIRPFMDAKTFRGYVRDNIQQALQEASANAQQMREEAKRIEIEAER